MVAMDSIYTQVIKGELPSHRIYEDSKCIVFMDIHPVQPGHALVVPKKQIEFIWDLPENLYNHLWKIAHRVAEKQKEVLHPNRVGVIIDGAAVPHAHIQMIPLNGEYDLDAKRADTNHDELHILAQKLKLEN
jgi:histidine triad (HIT) family protein